MTGTCEALINEAILDLGYIEGPTTPYGIWYAEYTGQPDQGFESAAWCDMAVSNWAYRSGNDAIVGVFAYVPFHEEWFKAQGIWHEGVIGIQRGDIVIFDWNADIVPDHIGIVEFTDDFGIHTIEGNTGNPHGVYQVIRPMSAIAGYGRPNYDPEVPLRPQDQILRLGATGPAVVYLQQRLNVWGAGLVVDGDFGLLTLAAVTGFQAAHKLETDGIVGPLTWAELDKNPTVKVPNLIGKTAGEAHNALDAARLVPTAVAGQKPTDIVTATRPAAGMVIEIGSKVEIIASPPYLAPSDLAVANYYVTATVTLQWKAVFVGGLPPASYTVEAFGLDGKRYALATTPTPTVTLTGLNHGWIYVIKIHANGGVGTPGTATLQIVV